MPSDVTEAAERLRRKERGERVTAIYPCPNAAATKGQRIAYATVQQTRDRATCAAAYIAERPNYPDAIGQWLFWESDEGLWKLVEVINEGDDVHPCFIVSEGNGCTHNPYIGHYIRCTPVSLKEQAP